MLKKILSTLLLLSTVNAFAAPIEIVAAENFYGDLAAKIGGPYVKVTNILQNPNQDPHLFTANPVTAHAISRAQLIINNGLGYDSWVEKAITKNNAQQHTLITVANLIRKHSGDNPHIWYDPTTMPIYVNELVRQFSLLDPEHKAYFEEHKKHFDTEYKNLNAEVETLKGRYQNFPVIATEPVFNYMATAIGLQMQGDDFQQNVMKEQVPSAKEAQAFAEKLRVHAVKALIYNRQVTDPITEHMKNVAKKAALPIIGVSEMQPENKTYINWMLEELQALDKALAGQK
ncbi:metal ABC transporter solute-binding protein [soil metagenome]